MSSINAPQWFKDALEYWPTAVWLPLPDLIGMKETGDFGYFSPRTRKSYPIIYSDDVKRDDYYSSAGQFEYPNSLFMPYEKGVWDYRVEGLELFLSSDNSPALKNGAIIIMGYGICGETNSRLDFYIDEEYPYKSYFSSHISVGDSLHPYTRYVGNPLAKVRTRYALESTNINNNQLDYADNPPHAYRDFCLPQFRCAVLGISPTGDCVVGQGHPMYAHMRDQQQDYISIGTIADISGLKAVGSYVFNGNMGNEIEPKRLRVIAGVTFVEVLIPGVAPISFPAIPGASNWWRNHNLTSEGGASGLVLDKRGFPVSGFNYTPGMIPLDPY